VNYKYGIKHYGLINQAGDDNNNKKDYKMAEFTPLDQLNLDGTDDEKTLNVYTALTVKAIHQAIYGNGKKGINERLSFVEKKVWFFIGGFTVIVFILEIIF